MSWLQDKINPLQNGADAAAEDGSISACSAANTYAEVLELLDQATCKNCRHSRKKMPGLICDKGVHVGRLNCTVDPDFSCGLFEPREEQWSTYELSVLAVGTSPTTPAELLDTPAKTRSTECHLLKKSAALIGQYELRRFVGGRNNDRPLV